MNVGLSILADAAALGAGGTYEDEQTGRTVTSVPVTSTPSMGVAHPGASDTTQTGMMGGISVGTGVRTQQV